MSHPSVESKVAQQAGMAAQQRVNVHALSVRDYLDGEVVPTVLQGLAAVARERPDNPVEYLAAFLIKNNPKRLQKMKMAQERQRIREREMESDEGEGEDSSL